MSWAVIERSLSGRASPAVLFGAGVSAAPPASLPTAWALFEAYRDRLCTQLGDRPDGALPTPPIDDWMRGLRFEEVVSIFERIGLGLDAVTPLDSARAANANHRLLASLALCGWPLVTTNFDILAELAILEAGGDPTQAVDRDDFRADSLGDFRLHKLHGSFWRWRAGSWSDSRESICATFESIGAQYARYLKNDTQKLFLANLLRERPLVVVGYSGSDDLDIAPIVLRAPREQPLIWVQHDVSSDGAVVATSLAEVPAAARKLVPETLFDSARRHPVVWLRDDTTEFLRRLTATAEAAPAPLAAPAPARPDGAGRELPAAVFGSTGRACLFLGMLLLELGKPYEAIATLDEALRLSLQEERSSAAVLAAYELGRAYKAAGDDDRAEQAARRCLDVVHGANPHVEAGVLHFLGRLARKRSLIDAEVQFRSALALTDPVKHGGLYGSVLADLGDLAWKRGRPQEAYDFFVQAVDVLESSGVLEELKLAEHRLAILLIELDLLDEASSLLRESAELAEKLGDLDASVAVLHELGIIEERRGRYVEAETHFAEAAQRAAAADDLLSEALAEYHLGWGALRRGDVDGAERLERRSSARLAQAGEEYFLAHNLQLAAVVCLHRGRISDGRRILEQALAASERNGDAVHAVNCEALLRTLDEAGARDGTPFRLQIT